jgi:hypothetical protein
MEEFPKFEVLRKTGLISTGFDEDTQLDYDIEEQNTMEIEIRVKKTPTDLDIQQIRDIRTALNLPAQEPNSNDGLLSVEQRQSGEFQKNFYFHKRIGYLAGPKTLMSLDVDLRSLDSLKFYGLRPSVTHQFDKLTKLRFGVNLMPGSTGIILAASRTVSPGV